MSSRTENGDAWRLLQGRRAVSASGRPAGQGRNSPGKSPGAGEENAGWSVFSYLIAGMAAYGGIGWLAGHWLHAAILFPVGMLTGLVLAIVLIIYRYGRP
jgi:ATP synthase protein I